MRVVVVGLLIAATACGGGQDDTGAFNASSALDVIEKLRDDDVIACSQMRQLEGESDHVVCPMGVDLAVLMDDDPEMYMAIGLDDGGGPFVVGDGWVVSVTTSELAAEVQQSVGGTIVEDGDDLRALDGY